MRRRRTSKPPPKRKTPTLATRIARLEKRIEDETVIANGVHADLMAKIKALESVVLAEVERIDTRLRKLPP